MTHDPFLDEPRPATGCVAALLASLAFEAAIGFLFSFRAAVAVAIAATTVSFAYALGSEALERRRQARAEIRSVDEFRAVLEALSRPAEAAFVHPDDWTRIREAAGAAGRLDPLLGTPVYVSEHVPRGEVFLVSPPDAPRLAFDAVRLEGLQ